MKLRSLVFIVFLQVIFFVPIHAQAIQLAFEGVQGSGSTYSLDSDYDNGIMGVIGSAVYTYAYSFSEGKYRIWSFDSKTKLSKLLFESTVVEDISNIVIKEKNLYFIADNKTLFIIKNGEIAKELYKSADYLTDVLVFNNKIHLIDDIKLVSVDDLGQKQLLHTFGFFGVSAMQVFKDQLIIIGRDGSNNAQLFVSNGQVGGTQPYFSLGTGSEFSRDHNMTVVGDKMFFWYHPQNDPYDLWVTDGTSLGTKKLKNFKSYSFEDFKKDKSIIAYKNKLYFRGKTDVSGDHLYVSDGTVAGTKLFFNPNTNPTDPSQPKNFTIYKDVLYFSVINDFYNPSLYSTSGSSPIKVSTGFNYAGLFATVFKDSLYFSGGKTTWAAELFSSKGSATSSKQISNLSDSNIEFYPNELIASEDVLYFTGRTAATGRELYFYDPKFSSAIDDDFNSSTMKVFPNPAGHYLCYQVGDEPLNTQFNYSIQSIDGNILMKNVDGNGKIDISNLISGIYILNVNLNEKSFHQIFTKK